MRAAWAVLALWAIAFAATFALVRDRGVFTILAPVFAICMIGSVTIIRRAVGMR